MRPRTWATHPLGPWSDPVMVYSAALGRTGALGSAAIVIRSTKPMVACRRPPHSGALVTRLLIRRRFLSANTAQQYSRTSARHGSAPPVTAAPRRCGPGGQRSPRDRRHESGPHCHLFVLGSLVGARRPFLVLSRLITCFKKQSGVWEASISGAAVCPSQ